MAGGGTATTTHDDIEKQVIPCGVSQAAPLFPVANGSLIMPFQVDPNGALFVRPSGGQLPADALPAPATSADSTSYTMIWNGASWDRLHEGIDGDAQATGRVGQAAVISKGLVFNGATWDRWLSLPDNADSQVTSPVKLPGVVNRGEIWNSFGQRWDRAQGFPTNTDSVGAQNYGIQSVTSHGYVFNGVNFDRVRSPKIFKTATITAAGSTAIWVPAVGKSFRLMGYSIEVTGNAIQAAAGNFEIVLLDAATAIGVGSSLYIPSVALNVFGSNALNPINIGNGYLAANINNALNVNLSAALTGGEIRVNVWGTEE